MVVAKGDGSFHWEEAANRMVDVASSQLSVMCRMSGETEVSSDGSSSASGNERPSAIDMSVNMDAAKELNPAFGVQVPAICLLYWMMQTLCICHSDADISRLGHLHDICTRI